MIFLSSEPSQFIPFKGLHNHKKESQNSKMRIIIISLFLINFLGACSTKDVKKQAGIPLNQIETTEGTSELKEKLSFTTRPGKVLLTAHSMHRLILIYKVNYNKKRNRSFIGTTHFHRFYSSDYYEEDTGFQHYMPGIEAAYGYNMLNVAHYNFDTKQRNKLFEEPVLVNTLYYPSFRQDSLQHLPIERDYYMVSVYDEDTNRDSLIDKKDLRRLYYFDIDGISKRPLVPLNYSVLSSEYDIENDVMYVHAKYDQNSNGKREEEEPIHIFGIHLKLPQEGERVY